MAVYKPPHFDKPGQSCDVSNMSDSHIWASHDCANAVDKLPLPTEVSTIILQCCMAAPLLVLSKLKLAQPPRSDVINHRGESISINSAHDSVELRRCNRFRVQTLSLMLREMLLKGIAPIKLGTDFSPIWSLSVVEPVVSERQPDCTRLDVKSSASACANRHCVPRRHSEPLAMNEHSTERQASICSAGPCAYVQLLPLEQRSFIQYLQINVLNCGFWHVDFTGVSHNDCTLITSELSELAELPDSCTGAVTGDSALPSNA